MGRLVGRWDVIEHLQDAGDQQHQHQEDRQPARRQRIAQARLPGRDGGRMEMVEESGTHLINYILKIKTAPLPEAVFLVQGMDRQNNRIRSRGRVVMLLCLKHRQIFHRQAKGQDAGREDANRNEHFRQGREVMHIVAMKVGM